MDSESSQQFITIMLAARQLMEQNLAKPREGVYGLEEMRFLADRPELICTYSVHNIMGGISGEQRGAVVLNIKDGTVRPCLAETADIFRVRSH